MSLNILGTGENIATIYKTGCQLSSNTINSSGDLQYIQTCNEEFVIHTHSLFGVFFWLIGLILMFLFVYNLIKGILKSL